MPPSSAKDVYFRTCRWRLSHAESAINWLNRFTFDYARTVSDEGDPPPEPGTDQIAAAAVAASNAVHQMRCSLDNLICDLVELNDHEVTYANAFPVRTEMNARSRSVISRKTAGMHASHVAAVEICQPYHGPEAHPLQTLEELWTTDKHKLLSLVHIKPAPYAPWGFPQLSAEGFALKYPDGRSAVETLRRCLAFVHSVIEMFEPALQSRNVDVSLLWPRTHQAWVTLKQRDNVGSYTDDLSTIASIGKQLTSLEQAAQSDLVVLLDAADRVAASPVSTFHQQWLDPLRRRLTDLLESR
jgi:hypothetical protein